MVCLINNDDIENRILIDCNRTDLRENYAIPFTYNYISDIAESEEADWLYLKVFVYASLYELQREF